MLKEVISLYSVCHSIKRDIHFWKANMSMSSNFHTSKRMWLGQTSFITADINKAPCHHRQININKEIRKVSKVPNLSFICVIK